MFIPLINSLIINEVIIRMEKPMAKFINPIMVSANWGHAPFPNIRELFSNLTTNIKEISPVPIFILQHVMKMYFPGSEEK